MKKKLPDKTHVVLQYGGKSVTYAEILTCMEAIWTRDFGKKVEEIESLNLYIKPEENKVYYVVNASMMGDFEL